MGKKHVGECLKNARHTRNIGGKKNLQEVEGLPLEGGDKVCVVAHPACFSWSFYVKTAITQVGMEREDGSAYYVATADAEETRRYNGLQMIVLLLACILLSRESGRIYTFLRKMNG